MEESIVKTFKKTVIEELVKMGCIPQSVDTTKKHNQDPFLALIAVAKNVTT
jgi:hypothetical protein